MGEADRMDRMDRMGEAAASSRQRERNRGSRVLGSEGVLAGSELGFDVGNVQPLDPPAAPVVVLVQPGFRYGGRQLFLDFIY